MWHGSFCRPRRWLAAAAMAAVIGAAGSSMASGQVDATPSVVVCPTCEVTSLTEAIAAAPPNATIEVRGGVYPGGLVIERPVHLVGVDQPVVDGGGAGTLVTIRNTSASLGGFLLRGTGDNLDHEDAAIVAEKSSVTLTGNRIEDALFGIYLKQAPDSVVRDNVIRSKDVPIARKGDGIRSGTATASRLKTIGPATAAISFSGTRMMARCVTTRSTGAATACISCTATGPASRAIR